MQRVFDVNNEKDVRDLFDILPDNVWKIEKLINNGGIAFVYDSYYDETPDFFKIKWGDKTEITRPIQEATVKDIGKLCVFWDLEQGVFGKNTFCCTVLDMIDKNTKEYRYIGRAFDIGFKHCRRLTKQEIEDLC